MCYYISPIVASVRANSLVPQGGLVCEECPLGLNAFLSTRHRKGLSKSDGELHEIMIESRGHSAHTGRGIEPTV